MLQVPQAYCGSSSQEAVPVETYLQLGRNDTPVENELQLETGGTTRFSDGLRVNQNYFRRAHSSEESAGETTSPTMAPLPARKL
jgi:hypothetical protein